MYKYQKNGKINMKWVAIIPLFLLIPNIMAIQSTQECLNSTHLKTRLEWTKCDTTCQDYNITQTAVRCPYGCDTVDEECKEPEWKTNLYIIGIVIVIMIIIVWVLKR